MRRLIIAVLLFASCSVVAGGPCIYQMIKKKSAVASAGSFPLAGWDKRVKLTVSSAVVDSPLTNFPVLVVLSTASGIGGTNLVAVFNEITSNSLKIAITEGDGSTELYCEVEKWDFTGTNAWIWFKAPLIDSGSDTDFYLYYDNDHEDNTNHVGAVNSAVATNVWSPDFGMVLHVSESGTGTRYDSTANNADAATVNYNGDEHVTGQIDGADDLDGVDDGLLVQDNDGLDISINATISVWLNPSAWDATYQTVCDKWNHYRIWRDSTSGDLQLLYYRSDTTIRQSKTTLPGTAQWTHVVATIENNFSGKIYYNGVDQSATASTWSSSGQQKNQPMSIGYRPSASREMNGVIDELRIMPSRVMSAAEIKAEYNSGNDSFITYGAEETP